MSRLASSSLGTSLLHDVELVGSNGLKIGLMLARAAGETPDQPTPKQWRVEEIPTPTNVRVTLAGTDIRDFPPEMAAVQFRDTNKRGFGASSLDDDKGDYFTGNVMSSVARKLLLPPHVEEITLPTSEATGRTWAEFLTQVYVSDGRYVHRSSDGVTFTQVLDVGAGNVVTQLQAFGASDGDIGLIACHEDAAGVAQDYFFSVTGNSGAWTQQTQADCEYQFMFVKDETLYGLVDPNTLRTTTDPFDLDSGPWSGATQVGDELHDFQGGFVVEAVLIIFKEDRVFTIDSTGAVFTLIAQFANNPGVRNFASFIPGFNSNMYFTVDEEIWEYDPLAGELRALGAQTRDDTLFGQTLSPGIAYDGQALYSIHTTTLSPTGTTLIRTTFDPDNVPRFERWLHKTGNGLRPQGPLHSTRLFTSTTTGRHLWINTDTVGKVLRMDMPRALDPTLDTASRYTSEDAVYRTGWMSHNFPSQSKAYTEVAIDAQKLTPAMPAVEYDAFYYLDQDLTTRVTLGTNVSTNGVTEFELTGVTASSFLLELVLRSHNQLVTPELLNWTVRAAVKFPLREIITLSCIVGDHIKTRKGTNSQYTADQIRTTLRSLRKAEDITITYDDYKGYSFTSVQILPGFQEDEQWDESQKGMVSVITFKVMRVAQDTTGIFVVGKSEVAGPDVVE